MTAPCVQQTSQILSGSQCLACPLSRPDLTYAPCCPVLLCPVLWCGRVTDQGFALLAGLPTLQTLWVDCCNLSTAVLMSLACKPQLGLLEVHRSHPEAPGLGVQQLQLLSRVKGPRLQVVLREGHRPREELMRAHDGLGGPEAAGGVLAGSWGLGEGLCLGASGAEGLLEAADLLAMGSGALLGAAGGDGGQFGVVEWMPDWLPDLGGLHV